jgi:hypothetical protein
MRWHKKTNQGLPDDDPEWIKEISDYAKNVKIKLTDEDKRLIRELFFEYRRDGLMAKDALEKAKNVALCFKN